MGTMLEVLERAALDNTTSADHDFSIVPDGDSNIPSWEQFPGTGRVRAWARELRSACAVREQCDAVGASWSVTGRAAILIGEEMRTCRAVAHRAAIEAGMRFIFVADDDVTDIPSAAAFRRIAPAMVFLEAGKWMAEPEKEDQAEVAEMHRTFRERLETLVKEFDESQPVVFVTSAFRITDVVEGLRRVGLFDRFLNVPAPTMEAYGNAMIEKLGRHNCGQTVTQSPAKLGQLFRMSYVTERREALALLRLHRQVGALARPLEFSDIVNVETHGFIEEDAPHDERDEVRRETACHEAGHAAMAVIDSRGKNTPDFSSIIPSADSRGVVVDSYDYHANLGNRVTYASFRHKIRVWLAGRAAEELYLGAANVTNGCSLDLEKATRDASTAFAMWGFAPGMDDGERGGANLAVVVEDPSASECAHVEGEVRAFLTSEYKVVKELLAAHKPFVDAIVERLMWDSMVDQKTLRELAAEHVPGFVQEPLAIA